MSARVRLLASDLENKLARDLDKKASREIVDAHYQEIIARLDRIERNQNGRHAEDA